MNVGEYTLANPEKADRAINGMLGSEGQLKGGVGTDADEATILAEYDRLGGLILKGTYKVKTGSFYDFKNKAPFNKPKPMLVFSVNGETVEVPADKPLPIEVQAAELADTKKKDKARAKGKGKKTAADDAADTEDADDEDGEEPA